MHDLHTREQTDSTLRWGGLAGILGSILMLLTFGIVAVFVGMDTMSSEQALMRFPDIRAARTVENSLYLVVLLLWVIHSSRWTALCAGQARHPRCSGLS